MWLPHHSPESLMATARRSRDAVGRTPFLILPLLPPLPAHAAPPLQPKGSTRRSFIVHHNPTCLSESSSSRILFFHGLPDIVMFNNLDSHT